MKNATLAIFNYKKGNVFPAYLISTKKSERVSAIGQQRHIGRLPSRCYPVDFEMILQQEKKSVRKSSRVLNIHRIFPVALVHNSLHDLIFP